MRWTQMDWMPTEANRRLKKGTCVQISMSMHADHQYVQI